MSDDDPHDAGIFISTDGMKGTVPWRLSDYGDEGPLTDSQVSELAARFDLDRHQLRHLSSALGQALSTKALFGLAEVSRRQAVAKATQWLRKVDKDVTAARKRLADAAYSLMRLSAADPRSDQAKLLERCGADLVSSLHQLQEVPARLDLLLLARGEVLVLDPIDKRELRDERRKAVLRAVFWHWYRAGRSLSCTTDPINKSERRGPVIDFANAVVACVTDPPTPLSGETIYKDMVAIRDFFPAAEQAIKEIKNRNRDT